MQSKSEHGAEAKAVTKAYSGLCKALAAYSKATGRNVCFYVASGSPVVIDRDATFFPENVEDGGCILIELDNPHKAGASFDGGDW